MYGDYIDIPNKGRESQVNLFYMLAEKMVVYNPTEYKYSNQYFLIYFNRLTNKQREDIIEKISLCPWFIGYVDVTHSSCFKSYISHILMHL